MMELKLICAILKELDDVKVWILSNCQDTPVEESRQKLAYIDDAISYLKDIRDKYDMRSGF